MERWSSKVALVTGASAGIGAAIARSLVQHGMKVIGVSRNPEKIKVCSTLLRWLIYYSEQQFRSLLFKLWCVYGMHIIYIMLYL